MVANFGDLRSSVSEGGWKVTVDVRSVSLSGRDATDGNLFFLGCFFVRVSHRSKFSFARPGGEGGS